MEEEMAKCCAPHERTAAFIRNYCNIILVILMPLLLIPVPITLGKEGQGLYVLLLMSVFWMTEAIPLGVTSLLPLVLAPALGIIDCKTVASNYAKDATILLMGGLVAGLCIERWNLHKRIALRVLISCGTSTRWLMLGIMIPCWFLSMWISNTAAAAMMVPIVAAIIDQLFKSADQTTDEGDPDDVVKVDGEEIVEIRLSTKGENGTAANVADDDDSDETKTKIRAPTKDEEQNTRTAMLLAVAYACTCGGLSTLTGTGPNMLFKGTVDRLYGDAAGITFGSWMTFALPLAVISLIICWLWMHIHFFGFRSTFMSCGGKTDERISSFLRGEYSKLGPISYQEKMSLGLFTLLVVLWLTRDSELFPGWTHLLGNGTFAGDSTAAMFVVLLMLIVPAYPLRWRGGSKYTPLLEWTYMGQMFPWHIFFLFGGGFALADICVTSGITTLIVSQLSALRGLSGPLIILVVSILISLVTEVTSNTAIANLVLPITADLASALELHPMYLLVTVTIACSFSFMLPSATPPNAVVFSQGSVTVVEMMKAGAILNVFCLILLQVAMCTWAVPIFNLDTFPDWAHVPQNISTGAT